MEAKTTVTELPPLKVSKALVYLQDLSENDLDAFAASLLADMLAENDSLVALNLSGKTLNNIISLRYHACGKCILLSRTSK